MKPYQSVTNKEYQMTYDNEAIVRNAYHTAEGNVLDSRGWIGSFTEDGVFNNVTGEASYRGEHLGDLVSGFAKMFPDIHRELHRVNVMGDVVAVELSILRRLRRLGRSKKSRSNHPGADHRPHSRQFQHTLNGMRLSLLLRRFESHQPTQTARSWESF
jgi:hypothetical protein